MACGITRMHSRMIDYTCRRLGGSVCFIYTCPCCKKEYCNLRCLSAEKCKGSPGLAVWFLNGKMQWQLECRGRKWLRCEYCCALYLWGRGKNGEHTKDKCLKWKTDNATASNAHTNDQNTNWKVENAAANDMSLDMTGVSSGMNSLSLAGNSLLNGGNSLLNGGSMKSLEVGDSSFITGSKLGPFGSGGESVASGAVESGGDALEIHLYGARRWVALTRTRTRTRNRTRTRTRNRTRTRTRTLTRTLTRPLTLTLTLRPMRRQRLCW